MKWGDFIVSTLNQLFILEAMGSKGEEELMFWGEAVLLQVRGQVPGF